RREEPFFPLVACWPTRLTHTRATRGFPAARLFPSAPHGIIPPPLLPSASPLPAISSPNSLAVLFAVFSVYNTVVIVAQRSTRICPLNGKARVRRAKGRGLFALFLRRAQGRGAARGERSLEQPGRNRNG